uniref:Uncharacterized protein n=1 Tax=viral metagenome TaxID=1070528 RepID=A0A6M3KHN9_9ZZZZ
MLETNEMSRLIINTEEDTNYADQVRALLGVDNDELSDATLLLDIVLGAAEREVCSKYVPNWVAILNGSDQIKADSLKACVIIKVALNLISVPAVQNIMIDEVKFIDTIEKSKQISIDKVKESLANFFDRQLSMVGIERSSSAWPEKTIIGKSATANFYDYYVNTDGNMVSR